MDSGIEYQLSELISTIKKSMKFGSSPFSNPSTGGKNTTDDSNAGSGFAKSAKMMTGALSGMHAGSNDFIYGLQRSVGALAGVSEAFIGLELAIGAFKEVLKIGNTFSKMTDIGQNFNGSLFTMMEQVGKSGLSLDQFSAMMARNSMTSAMMGKSLGTLQMSVRDNLKQFGFYGMTLDELTNTSTDYMETLRESGRLGSLNETDQRKAVIDLVAQTSGVAKAFGKSREEILKNTNEIMRSTNLSARLSTGTQAQTDAVQSFVTEYAGFSKTLSSSFGEQFGKGGYVENELGSAAIMTGMGGLNNVIDQSINAAKRGQKMTAGMMANQMSQFDKAFSDQQIEQLEILSKGGNVDAMKMLAFANETRAITRDKKFLDATGRFSEEKYKAFREQADKDAKIQEGITQNAMTFESTFKKITGGFIEGFYGTFAAILGSKGTNLDSAMQGLHDLFLSLGTATGGLLGVVLKVVGWFGLLYTAIDKGVAKIKDMFGFGTKDDDGKSNTTGGALGGLAGVVATVVALFMAGSVTKRFMGFLLHGGLALPGKAGSMAASGVAMLSKLPGMKWLANSRVANMATDAASTAVGGAGGECCSNMIDKLTGIHDSINLHGDRAHTNATTLKNITKTGVEAAEVVEGGAGAVKGGIAAAERVVEGGAGAVKGAGKIGIIDKTVGALEKVGQKIVSVIPGGERAATFMEGIGSKVLSKMPAGLAGPLSKMAKFLPGVGLAVTGAAAVSRGMHGDYIAAAAEMASGVVGLIPGFGLVGEGLIQAGLSLYDNTKATKENTDAKNAAGGPEDQDVDSSDVFSTVRGTAVFGHETTGASNESEEDKRQRISVTNQLTNLNKMKADLKTKLAEDVKGNDDKTTFEDIAQMKKYLEQITQLNAQQTKLQKDAADRSGTDTQNNAILAPA